jgi:hypothetical protein
MKKFWIVRSMTDSDGATPVFAASAKLLVLNMLMCHILRIKLISIGCRETVKSAVNSRY